MGRAFGWGALAAAVAVVTASLGEPRVSAEDAPAKPAFVGPENCKKCHLKQYKSWKATPMARSFDALKPNAAADKKKAGGLDPAADFTKEARCLKCHTTGYGLDTGYPAPPAEGKTWTAEETARATMLQSTTCEACHGPGSLYGPYKKEHEDFKLAEIQQLGATTPPTREQCMTCHTKDCPAMPADYAFDFEKAKTSKDVHDHVPLKHPH